MSPSLVGRRGDRWAPLLAGEEARQARDVALAIGDALRDIPLVPRGDASLASGSAGLALTLFELHRNAGDRGYAAAARAHLEAAVAGLAHARVTGRFLTGMGGILWTALSLRSALELDDADPLVRQVDEALVCDAPSLGAGRYDLGSGLVGWGVYAAASRPWPHDPALLQSIVTRFESFAQPHAHGTPWFTPARSLSPSMRPLFPDGHHDLGLAHGVAGPVAWLCTLSRIASVWPRARTLGATALRWLLAQRRDDGSGFPAFAGDATPARAAWCYGDPGIAIAIAGARRISRENLHLARAVAEHAAARPAPQTGVVDAGLCHGAAGLAHLYHRLARVTQSPALFDAARSWLLQVLRRRRPGTGIGGFRSFVHESSGGSWHDDGSLLTGAAGIALVLTAAVSTKRPIWDRAFLLALEDADDDGRTLP
jgi:lantibiotic biosynthesis protein